MDQGQAQGQLPDLPTEDVAGKVTRSIEVQTGKPMSPQEQEDIQDMLKDMDAQGIDLSGREVEVPEGENEDAA